jgi:hypothetical protein
MIATAIESTKGAFCCPIFRVTTWELYIDPRFAKLIRGSWFAKVVVMSERSTEQIREFFDSLYRVDSGRILATLIRLLGDFDCRGGDARSLCGCAEPVAEEWSTRQPATMVDFDGPIQSH